MNKTQSNVLRLAYAAVCLALCIVLPFLTGQIPQIGKLLSPMHIPVLLCGFLCGWPYGLVVGFVAPLLRGAMFGMPALMPTGLNMAFELAAYGVLSGILYRVFPKKAPYVYLTLIIAMIGGRIVGGLVSFLLYFSGLSENAFSLAGFFAAYVTGTLPGMAVHVILIPIIVLALQRAGLIPDAKKA